MPSGSSQATDAGILDAPSPVVEPPLGQPADAASLKSSVIMIVDDIPVNVKVARAHLETAGYSNFIGLTDATEAIDTIQRELPDLVLLDIMMPHVSGLDILRSVRTNHETMRLPVLILTGSESPELKTQALELGATDFLTKPIDVSDLHPRVRNILVMKSYEDDLKQQVKRRTAELEQSQQELVHCLARAAEFRDNETGAHVIRVGKYAGLIASELGMEQGTVSTLTQAATLHDVGKIGIPDSILRKPGELDPDESRIMQQHCGLGREVLKRSVAFDDSELSRHTSLGAEIMEVCSSPMIKMARSIALTHHERWDGSGYPLGLTGEEIPLEGRITAVADVFDALSSRRHYKSAFPLDKCLNIIKEQSGTQFDPDVVSAFLRRTADIVDVQLEHADIC